MKHYYEANRERVLEQKKQYYEANKERVLELRKQRYETNREQGLAYQKQYYEANRERELERRKQHYQENKDYYWLKVQKRRAIEDRATPKWLSEEQKEQMQWLKRQALFLEQEAPDIGWHVDHIVPLISEHVCGLNVPWNLQVLPATLNLSKSNRLDWKLDCCGF